MLLRGSQNDYGDTRNVLRNTYHVTMLKKVKMILLALLPRPEAHGRGKGGQKRPQIREAGGGGTNQGRNWKCQQKVIRAKS